MTIKDIFKDYEKVRLEDWSCDIASGQAVSSVDGNYEKEGIRFIQGNNLTNDGFVFEPMVYIGAETHAAMPRSVVQPQDVLINIVGPPIGKICWYPEGEPEANINQAVVRVRCPDDLDYRFLTYLLRSDKYYNYFLNVKVGVRQWNISRTNCADIEIPRVPLSEQRALVSRLERQMEEIDRMRRAAEGQLEAARGMRRAILRQEIEHQQTDEIKIVPLSSLCSKVVDADHRMPPSEKEGFPLISTKDFTLDGGIDFSKAKRISKEELEISRKRCNPERGDILFSRYGTIGEVRYVDTEQIFALSYSVALIKPIPCKVNTKYLMYVLTCNAINNVAQTAENSSAIPDLGITDIRDFPIPIPDSLVQQELIANALDRKLNQVNLIIATAGRQLEAINALPGAYLREIFGTFESSEPDELPEIEEFENNEGDEEE